VQSAGAQIELTARETKPEWLLYYNKHYRWVILHGIVIKLAKEPYRKIIISLEARRSALLLLLQIQYLLRQAMSLYGYGCMWRQSNFRCPLPPESTLKRIRNQI